MASLAVTVGSTSHTFAPSVRATCGPSQPLQPRNGDRPEAGISAEAEAAAGLPAVPLLTTSSNLLFQYDSLPVPPHGPYSSSLLRGDAPEGGGDQGAAAGARGQRKRLDPGGASSWVATVVTVSVQRDGGNKWLGEMLRLAACVNAQLVTSLVTGAAPSDPEATNTRWLSSDIFKKGLRTQAGPGDGCPLVGIPAALGAEEVCEILRFLPGRPPALRHNVLLDEVEGAAACAMLHHLHLLPVVRDRLAAGEAWDMEADSETVSALKRVAAAASRVRRHVMMQRDALQAQELDDAPAPPARGGGGGGGGCSPLPAGWRSGATQGGDEAGPSGYETLCPPVISRALLLLQFVSAIAGEATLRAREPCRLASPLVADSPLVPPVSGAAGPDGQSERSAGSRGEGGATPSPLKRWQKAALKIVTREGGERCRGVAGGGPGVSPLPEKGAAGAVEEMQSEGASPARTPVTTPAGTPAKVAGVALEGDAHTPLGSQGASAPAPTPASHGAQGAGGGGEVGGWAAVLPLLRLHRACWRMRQMNKLQEDGVIELVVRFLMADLAPSSLDAALRRRELVRSSTCVCVCVCVCV